MHSTARPRWVSRAVLAGMTTIGLSVLGAAPTVQASAAPAERAAPSSAKCDPQADAEARVMAGMGGQDPNSLTAAQVREHEQLLAGAAKKAGKRKFTTQRLTNVNIRTYFHVITRADGTGGVTQQMIDDQMQVLNDGYSGAASASSVDTHFRFELAGVDYTANDDWYDWHWLDNSDDIAAKKALHTGGWRDLNIYVTDFDPPGLLGYATFPKSTPKKRDGVVVLNESLPGGTAAPYNEGDTLTHEVGHWLNLYHTFQGGCTYPGDFVTDTPAQADGDNIFFCNETDDTCPDAGLDPVHNFMSYGDDPCLDRFTAGQADRMLLSWMTIRKNG
jgi:Pregnancy-associated plasma protein-A